jgi:hypothetical protein
MNNSKATRAIFQSPGGKICQVGGPFGVKAFANVLHRLSKLNRWKPLFLDTP